MIGAGTAGFAAADTAREAGRTVQLVALPGPLGGTCILRGCMPAKTLLASTRAIGEVWNAEAIGVDAERPHVDLATVIRRKHDLVEYFAADRREQLAAFPLVRGRARFVSRDAIDVDGVTIRADRFVLATGSVIAPPAIEGIAACGYLTSDDVLDMTEAPRRLAIVGAGPVGCEFAQYFARIGTAVTLLQDGPMLLRNEDDGVCRTIATALERDGVRIAFDACAVRGERTSAERHLTYRAGDGAERTLDVDAILIAGGRVPNLHGLDLQRAGVDVRDGRLVLDDALRTTNPWILAAGDVIGRRCLVHVAEYAGALAARNAFSSDPQPADFDRFEAHAIYTEPEVAVAGLTEAQCRARGLAVEVRRHPFDDLGKALVSHEAEGYIAMIADDRRRIVGITIVGTAAIDLIGEGIALIDAGATVDRVARMPHLHPTMGEIYARVADDFSRASNVSASSAAMT